MSNPEVREKIRLSKLGKPSPRKGKTHTEEAKLKMSNSSKGQVPWNKGSKLRNEEAIKVGKGNMSIIGYVNKSKIVNDKRIIESFDLNAISIKSDF